jgi:hypothetical protein
VPGVILAAINPDNTPHGYNLTFAFPMLLFIIIALVLYALLSRPHRRIPGRPISVTPGASRTPDAHAARAAAVAGGLESAPPAPSAPPAETGGATLVASADAEDAADEPDDGTGASG